jgi:hypothetical protein
MPAHVLRTSPVAAADFAAVCTPLSPPADALGSIASLRYRHDPYSWARGAVFVSSPPETAAATSSLASTDGMSWHALGGSAAGSVQDLCEVSAAESVDVAAADGSITDAFEVPLTNVEAQHLLRMPYVPLVGAAAATRASETRPRSMRCGDGVGSWARDDLARELNGPAATAGDDASAAAAATRTRMASVFVAQLPFDMQLEALQELADEVVPGPAVRIVFAAPHLRNRRAYDGCAFLRMPEADAQRFVAALHKRVLFDVDGAWYAATAEQQQILQDYCAWVQEQPSDARRRILPRPTPFAAVTAEFAHKSGSRLMRSRNMRL